MLNPFSFVGIEVTGSNFIGRTKELRILRENTLIGGSTFIVGLPRMGKSSILANCFYEDRFSSPNQWAKGNGLIPIYTVVFESNSPCGLLDSLSTQLAIALDYYGVHLDYLDRAIEIEGLDAKFQCIVRALDKVKRVLKDRFVFILDEFDGVLRYPKDTNVLQKIRSLSRFGSIVTCSRRTPAFIEEELFGTKYFTKFANTVFVGQFSEEEVKEYWNRYSGYYSSFNKEQFSAYKVLVKQYVGNHPMLMSLMNYWLFQQGDDPFTLWHPGLPESQREDTERSIRVEIKNAFLDQMRYVEEQKLDRTAIQLVVGTSRMAPVENVDLLLKYQFISVVPNKVKKEIFGYNLGPTTADTTKRYICYSPLTSHLMKDIYDPDIEGYDLLKKTELDLREMIGKYLHSICTNPFYETRYGEEKWVECLKNRIDYHFLPDTSGLDKAFKEMVSIRDKRKSNDCKSSFDRTEINMLSSASLGCLWNVFIRYQWREYFARILDPNGKYRSSNSWYRSVFKIILDWRNAANHYNDAELSDVFLEQAKRVALQVDNNVCLWLGKRES